ncbi:LacI family DNA-binding transcriptional regulator [Pseudalkalibacillus caeni]|uniref:Catabolite control protein A n=1 Tax=Exobacillus caeni TaxID=2574798 RepID=A0A5R9F3W2_9BACL|nr:LacI family DNA-binding transcriptional regulator [Pseudalkalibacillus caeni]TLS38382.1 LacI family transcriptional regulator [Pseudalkalibacillus caeni]
MATIRDVAKAAGVSVATVSRVINKNEYVNKETEQKVIVAMQELHYEPSSLARGLAGKKMNTIALMIPDISNPFFPGLARGVEDVAQQYDFNVFLCNSDDLAYKEKSYLEILRKKSIDGLIIISNNVNEEELEPLRMANIPVVLLDRPFNEQNYSVVRSNNRNGAIMAVEHLLAIGCKKIAHIAGPEKFVTARERRLGYEGIVSQYSWYTPSLIEHANFDIEGGKQAVTKLVANNTDIDGIFAGNDLMALGALKQLIKLGKNVPDDIALCGFDGISLTELTQPEITTIQQPIYEMGAAAALTLIKKLKGEITETKIQELDVKLIIRGSTEKGKKLPLAT